jgi:hypothetical protein
LDNEPLIFYEPGYGIKIGAIDRKNQRIYLWDNTGNLCPGFPLFGFEKFSLSNINNDGSLYLVTGADNKVYVYSLR